MRSHGREEGGLVDGLARTTRPHWWRQTVHVNQLTQARFSLLITVWRISGGFLRVARDPTGATVAG
jgi:hypothetical protein